MNFRRPFPILVGWPMGAFAALIACMAHIPTTAREVLRNVAGAMSLLAVMYLMVVARFSSDVVRKEARFTSGGCALQSSTAWLPVNLFATQG